MSKPYNIGMREIDSEGGIAKLERDGFKREEIMQAIHRETDCAEFGHKTRTQQRELVQKLYDREKS